MKPTFDSSSITRVGLVAMLSPTLTSSVPATSAVQIEQRHSSALTSEVEMLEKSLTLIYSSQAPSLESTVAETTELDEEWPPLAVTYTTGHVVSREKPPFVFHDEWDDLEDDPIEISVQPVLPPKASFPVMLEIERIGRAAIVPLQIDEVDVELFDL